jgi:hypothetical protein
MMDPQMEVCPMPAWEACCADLEDQVRTGYTDVIDDIVDALDRNSPLLNLLAEGIISQDPARDTDLERALRNWVDSGLIKVTDKLMEQPE